MQEYWTEILQDKQEQENVIMREWEALQSKLLAFALLTPYTNSLSWKEVIGTHIMRYTQGKARVYWDHLSLGDTLEYDRYYEIRFRHIRHGFLGLAPGYLVSQAFPNLPQHLASLCALLITFAEYQTFVHSQLDYLPPLFPNNGIGKLTSREYDILLGLVRGESNTQMAERLGIESNTVHTHRQRLYRRLGVHSAQEATLRCFKHRLIDWLDKPNTAVYSPLEEEKRSLAQISPERKTVPLGSLK